MSESAGHGVGGMRTSARTHLKKFMPGEHSLVVRHVLRLKALCSFLHAPAADRVALTPRATVSAASKHHLSEGSSKMRAAMAAVVRAIAARASEGGCTFPSE